MTGRLIVALPSEGWGKGEGNEGWKMKDGRWEMGDKIEKIIIKRKVN